jgi:hypothetical protein
MSFPLYTLALTAVDSAHTHNLNDFRALVPSATVSPLVA